MRCTPSKEFIIATIAQAGVKAVYPDSKETKAQIIKRIKNTPDEEWYPKDDVFWQRRGQS
jgi:hypothetical protein